MKEIVILLVVLCVSAIGLSGAVAAWYFFYYRPKTMGPGPAPAEVLAPTYQTIVAPTYPPPVPKTGGGTGGGGTGGGGTGGGTGGGGTGGGTGGGGTGGGTGGGGTGGGTGGGGTGGGTGGGGTGGGPPTPSIPGETPSGAAWDDFQMVLGDGQWRLGDGANYRVVKGSDGTAYFYHKDSDPKRLLAFLEPCVAQMPALAAQLAKNLGATDPRVVKFEQWLGTMRLWKTSCIVIHEPPYPGSSEAGAFQMGNWCIMGGEWFNDECANPSRGNYKSCIGSVLHEVAHLICAPIPPHGCVGHGSGFCRVSAELLKAAHEIGMFVPYNVPGAWTWFTTENFQKIDSMRNVVPYEDGDCAAYI